MELRFGEAYFVVSREEAVWQFAPGAHPDVAGSRRPRPGRK